MQSETDTSDGFMPEREPIPSGRRGHPRFVVNAQVAVASDSVDEPMIARALNLSWGGACLAIPKQYSIPDDRALLRFPLDRGSSFSANTQVTWKRQLDDTRCLVGVRFTSLRVCDHEKLERLLSILVRSRDTDERAMPITDGLEVCFLDREEMLSFLERIRHGGLQTAVFKPLQPDERIRLVVTAFGNLPRLVLRARVLWQKPFGPATPGEPSGIFKTELMLDHPVEDLRRIADDLSRRLESQSDGARFARALEV
jgi:hypothetical protein